MRSNDEPLIPSRAEVGSDGGAVLGHRAVVGNDRADNERDVSYFGFLAEDVLAALGKFPLSDATTRTNGGTQAAPEIDAGVDLGFQPVRQQLEFRPQPVARRDILSLSIQVFAGKKDDGPDRQSGDTDQDVLDGARKGHVTSPGLGEADIPLGQGGGALSTTAAYAM
jgi:hypothetical protein